MSQGPQSVIRALRRSRGAGPRQGEDCAAQLGRGADVTAPQVLEAGQYLFECTFNGEIPELEDGTDDSLGIHP